MQKSRAREERKEEAAFEDAQQAFDGTASEHVAERLGLLELVEARVAV